MHYKKKKPCQRRNPYHGAGDKPKAKVEDANRYPVVKTSTGDEQKAKEVEHANRYRVDEQKAKVEQAAADLLFRTVVT